MKKAFLNLFTAEGRRHEVPTSYYLLFALLFMQHWGLHQSSPVQIGIFYMRYQTFFVFTLLFKYIS